MKSLLLLFVVFISGCCAFTSQDCGCQPPSPELTAKAREWINPYDNKAFLLFEDENNIVDTFKLERVEDIEFIGGDECGTDGEVQRAVLTSTQNPSLTFTISATRKEVVEINGYDETDKQLFVEISTSNETTFVKNENSTAIFDENYVWDSDTIKVLNVDCAGGSNCLEYPMKGFVLSKDLGLLNFTTNEDKVWKRIE